MRSTIAIVSIGLLSAVTAAPWSRREDNETKPETPSIPQNLTEVSNHSNCTFWAHH